MKPHVPVPPAPVAVAPAPTPASVPRSPVVPPTPAAKAPAPASSPRPASPPPPPPPAYDRKPAGGRSRACCRSFGDAREAWDAVVAAAPCRRGRRCDPRARGRRRSAQPIVSASASAEAPGTLTVSTNPAGVPVVIDGEPRGVTPLTLELAPGRRELRLAANGGSARVIPLTTTAGGTVSQSIELPTAGRRQDS